MIRKSPGSVNLILLLLLVILLLITVFIAKNETKLLNRASEPQSPALKATSAITKKVQLVDWNPIMTHHGNIRWRDYENQVWPGHDADPTQLTSQIISSLNRVSGGYLNYQIAEVKVMDVWPILADGFQYDDDSFIACYNDSGKCHQPQMMNYQLEVDGPMNSCSERNSGSIDETWMWGDGWYGFWESNLAGPGAFWYNSSPTAGTTCNHLLPVMGFNYSVGLDQALHSFGHRVESTMAQVYNGWAVNQTTPWNTFSLYDREFPGHARCGNVHYPPNGQADYDYSNPLTVKSACGNFYSYPNLPSPPTYVNVSCSTWGCTQLGYQTWWLSHIPHLFGTFNSVLNNWWAYVVDYENAIKPTNLLANPSFELDSNKDFQPDNWRRNNTSTKDKLVSTYAHAGKLSYVFAPLSGQTHKIYQILTAQSGPGQTVNLAVWHKLLPNSISTGGFIFAVLEVKYTDLTADAVRVKFSTTAHDWAKNILTLTTKKALNSITVTLGASNQNSYAYFDDLFLSIAPKTSIPSTNLSNELGTHTNGSKAIVPAVPFAPVNDTTSNLTESERNQLTCENSGGICP